MLDSDGADADPHRPRVVTNEEQRGHGGRDEIKWIASAGMISPSGRSPLITAQIP
jgi:hypothetical protein